MQHFDKNGIPIHKGDLLRSPHFIGPRRKQYYLYHVVVQEPDGVFLVPASHLEPTMKKDGGICHLDALSDSWEAEIISGYGPEPYLSYDDRPRRKRD
jgi:hypothetical protein